MTGPSPNARTYVVRGRIETVELIPHCFSRAGNAGEMTEEPKELFELLDHFLVLRGWIYAVREITAGATMCIIFFPTVQL
jgi:hypothetical protein